MGPDTGVPGLSHGHTQARTQGSWLHASVPLVSTGCGQGRRGAWYTREAKILAPFIMVPLLSHRMWAGVRGACTPCSSTARKAEVLAPFIMVPLLSHLMWAGVRGAWYMEWWWGTGYVQETTGEGCCLVLAIGRRWMGPTRRGPADPSGTARR